MFGHLGCVSEGLATVTQQLQEYIKQTTFIRRTPQEVFDAITSADLPEVGQSFDAHEEIGTIESVKAVAEVYTPLGGVIVAVNGDLEEHPEAVNDTPHAAGWLIKLEMRSKSELDSLMSRADYEQFTQSGE